MFRKSVSVVVLIAAVAAFADEPAFTNATFMAGLTQPKDWGSADMWVGGEPADGPGATATVRLDGTAPGDPVAVNFNRNVTLGHILRPADDTQGANYSQNEWRDNLIFRWDQLCQSYPDQVAPMTTSWKQSMRHFPVTLTMDSGTPSEKATIQHLVPSATMNGKRFGFFIEPPITLMSDLYLKYIGPSDRTYGTGWISGDQGDHADGAMYLTGGISEGVSGKGVEIDNPVLGLSSSYVYTPIFLGGISTFTGPLEITSGMLRLLGEGRFEGDCHAIGVNNHVYATTGNGVLDLAGTRAGLDGNTLHLGGVPARAEVGTLINTNPDPLVPGEWAGPVVIESATRIGGYTQNPSGNDLGGGDIVLSGPVSGSADVELVNRRETVLAGDNSEFSGNWILSDGFLRLRGENPVGTGKLVFRSWLESGYIERVGTGYRFGAADDADLTRFNYDVSNQHFRIDVAEGLEYHPANGFRGLAVENGRAALYKTGPGTLRLTEQSEYTGTLANYDWSTWLVIDDGTVVMDYTENGGPKLVGSKTNGREGTVRFGENTRLEILGTPTNVVGYFQYGLSAGACATVHFDDAGHSYENGFRFERGDIAGGDYGTSPAGGFLNIEADPAKWELIAGPHSQRDDTQHDALYPSIRFPGEIWNGETFTKRSKEPKWKPGMYSYLIEPVPDDWYATDFETTSSDATSPANSLVDVTPELCTAGTHADIECAALRFNTSNGGTPVVLDLDGLCKVHSGTILITPNMGSTPVVIRGGRIVRDPLVDGNVKSCNNLRIINMNTNATLTIESDLGADTAETGGTLVRGTVMFLGPGKTVFSGKFMGSGVVTVNGGMVSCGDGTRLLASSPASGAQWDKTWTKYREIYLYGGGLLEFTEDAPWTCEVAGQVDPSSGNTYLNGWRPHYGVSGGGISVAKGKTLTMSAPGWEVHQSMQRGAKFIKAGEGAISYAQACTWDVELFRAGINTSERRFDWIYRCDLRGGTVGRFETAADNGLDVKRILFGGMGAVVLTAEDGTKLVGREFSTTRLVDCNRASCDAGNGVRIVIPEGATVTHDRHATASSKPGELTFSAREWFPSGLRSGGLWAGAGTLVLTNSQGTAGMGWDGFRNRLFTGTIIDRVGTGDATKSDNNKYVGYVPALENARLFLPEGVAWYIGYGMDLDGIMPFRLGGLDGAGTIDCQQRWTSGIESLRVGSDDGESHDFAGRLRIARNGAYYGQLLKVGSNAQRISGEANELQTSARVLDGQLILGHPRALDSTDLPDSSNYIYVGGGDVTAGMTPEFLVDCGSVELANEVRVLGCASDEVVPGVGAKSGVVRFTKLMVSNDCALVAEAGATAQFDSITKFGSFSLSQRGAGTVEFTGDFAIDDEWALEAGAALVVDGVLTVADGAKLLADVPETLVPGQRYTLVSAGSIVGKFDLSGIAVPKGWKVGQYGSKVVIKEDLGLVIFVR